jgi:hypothetical protein
MISTNNQNTLNLDLEEYPGGVGMWPGLIPAFSSRPGGTKESGNGIHVHARKHADRPKNIDLTYQQVQIKVPENFSDHRLVDKGYFSINISAARAYWASSVYEVNLKCLYCPKCGKAHLDDGLESIIPHTKHTCRFCSNVFESLEETVSNPIVGLWQIFEGVHSTSPATMVDRQITINLAEYSGGIEIWGTAPAIFWTFKSNQDAGMHLHAFSGKTKMTIDETYSTILVNEIEISHKSIRYFQTQMTMPHLKGKVKTVFCPSCGEAVLDTGLNAVYPHTQFTCTKLHSFETEQAVVSNPAMTLLQSF